MDAATAKERVNRGIFYGFVPRRLEIEDRPELHDFPLNVMFMRYGIRDGKQVSATALYEPDIGSYRQEGEIRSMEYHNKYGPVDWLVIRYDRSRQRYTGEKTVNGECVGIADGTEWKWFFVHFTSLGLFNREHCWYEVETPKTN